MPSLACSDGNFELEWCCILVHILGEVVVVFGHPCHKARLTYLWPKIAPEARCWLLLDAIGGATSVPSQPQPRVFKGVV